jgi:hypothetical protein
MSAESQRVVRVRLEIEIPQGADVAVLRHTAEDKETKSDVAVRIDQPPPPTTTTPTLRARFDVSTSKWVICTRGAILSGSPPRAIYAATYSQGATVGGQPPPGSPGQVPDSTGQWGYANPFEVVVANPSGTSTFVLWADCTDHFQQFSSIDFLTDMTAGMTECQALSTGSGSGAVGGGFINLADLGRPVPATLYAHLSNAGGLGGVYPLAYDPVTRAWTSDAVCGPHGFRLRRHAAAWHLNVRGTAHAPAVAEGGATGPFQVVFKDVDLRPDGGANAAVEILLTPG